MDVPAKRQPLLFLIDDDSHSARFLMRKLENACEQRGGLRCEWFGSADDGHKMMTAMPDNTPEERPDLVIVDLKSNSRANEDFISVIAPIARYAGITLVTMVTKADDKKRKALLRAGAAEVFERCADIEEFKAEVAEIIEFSVRNMRCR